MHKEELQVCTVAHDLVSIIKCTIHAPDIMSQQGLLDPCHNWACAQFHSA